MHTPWGRKRRRRLTQLERIAACRVELRDTDGQNLVNGTVESLYAIAKFGNGGQVLVDYPGTFVFTV